MSDELSSEKDAESFLQHALMEETRSYVERGRALKDHSDSAVADIWVATVERWFEARTSETQRQMDDASAELRLRDIKEPADRVASLLAQMKEEIRRDPRELNEKTKQQILDFVAGRDKPQN